MVHALWSSDCVVHETSPDDLKTAWASVAVASEDGSALEGRKVSWWWIKTKHVEPFRKYVFCHHTYLVFKGHLMELIAILSLTTYICTMVSSCSSLHYLIWNPSNLDDFIMAVAKKFSRGGRGAMNKYYGGELRIKSLFSGERKDSIHIYIL